MTERTYTADEVGAMIARAVAAVKTANTLHFAQWTNGEKGLSNYTLVGHLTLAGIEDGEYGQSEINSLENTIEALQERFVTGFENKSVPLLAYIGALNTTQPAAQPTIPEGWKEFVQRVAKQKPEKPDYWSACGQCERNSNDAEDLLDAAQPADRHTLQAAGKHPAPCARFCEATAFQIKIRGLEGELADLKAAQPALPFGVGGGLAAIKTLLSRDPCAHANVAIGMIDAILKEHSAAQPAAPLTPAQKIDLAEDWFTEDWAITKAVGMMAEYEVRRACSIATPPAAQRQPLTDEQISEIASSLEQQGNTMRQFARAIEAAHGITKGGAA